MAAIVIKDYLLPMFESKKRKKEKSGTVADELKLSVKLNQ